MQFRSFFCVSLYFLYLSALPTNALSFSNEIKYLKTESHLTSTSITFETTQEPKHHTFHLKNPHRFVVDIEEALIAPFPKEDILRHNPISNIRTSNHNNLLRIVFDLKFPIQVRETQQKIGSDRYQLIFDFDWVKREGNTKFPYYEVVYQPKKSVPANAVYFSSPIKRLSDVVIVIDPGHGGHDPGAIGFNHVREKDVVLKISKQIMNKINQHRGLKAYLTRYDDRYLTLRERLAIARRHQADLFVAIHADAIQVNNFRYRKALGASVYALSERGATSEAARWLANQENASELMGGVELSDKNTLLKSVLINLSQTATIRSSLGIGHQLIRSLRNVGHLHSDRVEQAAFVVLKSPDIPSLLIETGFISNTQEERKLLNPNYQNSLADALTKGIQSYFEQLPPQGSWLSEVKFRRLNTIK